MRFVLSLVLVAVAGSLNAQAPSLTSKVTIGCESCGGPSQFGTIRDVSISSRGEVLVTDREAPIFRRFDAAGKLVWSGGAAGPGPGEFKLPTRSALVPSGMLVVDMTNSRVTALRATGEVSGAIPLTSLATTTSVNAKGDLLLGYDDFGRAFRIVKKAAGAWELREVERLPGSLKNKSVALAPDGGIAVALDGEKYEIARWDSAGKPLPSLTRDLPRPRRSAVEEAEYRQRAGREMAMVAAEMKRRTGSSEAKAIPIPPGERGLKAHIVVDGLRYDDSGRLWVHTMQGDETKTVFDVFAPSGAYLGAVTIPMRITSYSLRGSWMVAAGENGDGIPVVTVWGVK